MGGRVALQFALGAPDRLWALVLESASPGIDDADEREDRVRSDDALADEIEQNGIEAFVDRWQAIPLFASQSRLSDAARDELRRLATPETVVCRCEDVPLGQLENCRSAREAKLRTRAGMGPCQSRVCGPALAFLRGWGPDSVRPPLEPVMLSVLEDQQ